MTISAEALRKLAALKLSAEQYAVVLDVMADLCEADDERRAKGRERTRACRMKRYGDVTVTLQPSPPPDGPLLLPPQTPLITTPINPPSPSEKVDSPKPAKRRLSYPPEFEVFWKGYPTDQNMGKAETFAQWKRLSPEDQSRAIDSLPSFRAFCAKDRTYRPIHAVRYLSKARFEGHLEELSKPVTSYAPPMAGLPTHEELLRKHGHHRDEGSEAVQALPRGGSELHQDAEGIGGGPVRGPGPFRPRVEDVEGLVHGAVRGTAMGDEGGRAKGHVNGHVSHQMARLV